MKVLYDAVSPEHQFPLSRNEACLVVRLIPEVLAKIRTVRFGCNARTSQEGRTVKRGRFYDVRVNFCLHRGTSPLLSEDREQQEMARRFGGVPDTRARIIKWAETPAKRYAAFLLLHELAHIVYAEERNCGRLQGRGTPAEETWCDSYALSFRPFT